MRCEGCDGKFGSNGKPEVEVQSESINDSTIEIEVQVNVPCGNCSSEFKQGYLTIEHEFDVDRHDDECTITDPDNTTINDDGIEESVEVTLESDLDRFRELADRDRVFELGDINLEISDDYRPKFKEVRDRKTKQIKQVPVKFRYQTHWYDVTGTVSVRCGSCDGDTEVEIEGSMTASELEEVG